MLHLLKTVKAQKSIILKKALFLNSDSIEHKINRFKTYNKFGLKRTYKPSRKQVEKYKVAHLWTHNPEKTVYNLKDYKACYITIYKPKEKYIPVVNGSRLDKYPEHIKLNSEYDNIEDAKANAIKFVDHFSSLNNE